MLCFLTGAFPETQQLAEEAVRFQRDLLGVVGSGTDLQVVWTFPEIVTTAEARPRVLGDQMGWLSQASTAMMAALWPGSVTPTSFTRLVRWLEMGPDRLHEWRVFAARAVPRWRSASRCLGTRTCSWMC